MPSRSVCCTVCPSIIAIFSISPWCNGFVWLFYIEVVRALVQTQCWDIFLSFFLLHSTRKFLSYLYYPLNTTYSLWCLKGLLRLNG
ncbi:hypothetical protein JOM56_009318 [Amanita muscaria]